MQCLLVQQHALCNYASNTADMISRSFPTCALRAVLSSDGTPQLQLGAAQQRNAPRRSCR